MASFISGNGTFFDHIWSEDLDENFLFQLELRALREQRSLTFGDDDIFDSVLRYMHFFTNHALSKDDIHRRFKLANLRYHTWKGIIEHEGVTYDESTYSIKRTKWTWIELFETYELAVAYHKVEMERMWPELCAIFGDDAARSPGYKAALPVKPPRVFERICPDGSLRPTLDALLAQIMEDEKRAWEEKHLRELKRNGMHIDNLPPDCMSSTKGQGIELLPAREVITISPEMNRATIASTSTSGEVRAKRALNF